jgi:hypothetical protein
MVLTIRDPEEVVRAVREDIDYGYQGRILDIRKTEYAHVGGSPRAFSLAKFQR